MDLQQGSNAAIAGARATVSLQWPATAGDVEVDVSAYLLTAAGKVRGDGDMVFYNQSHSADGAVTYDAPGDGPRRFAVDLATLPAEIDRIVFCATISGARPGCTLATIAGAGIAVEHGGERLSFRPHLTGAAEAAMTFGELYRRQGGWKFRAVGQGFNGGLGPLARSFGIDVADQPPPPSAPNPPPAPAPAPVNLAKVSLEKPGQKVSPEKKGASFGEIVVNLNWSRGKRSFFGGGTAIDLDLGCLFELANGRVGAVQALGRAFGSFNQPPYIELSGDDRTGDVAQGETIRINGAHWSSLRRVALFANIYDGVPNWRQTDGVVTVIMSDQAPVEVRMTEGRNDRRLCGIAMIENVDGRFVVTKLDEYFGDQEQLDRRFGFGLRWRAGSKD